MRKVHLLGQISENRNVIGLLKRLHILGMMGHAIIYSFNIIGKYFFTTYCFLIYYALNTCVYPVYLWNRNSFIHRILCRRTYTQQKRLCVLYDVYTRSEDVVFREVKWGKHKSETILYLLNLYSVCG